MNPNDIFDKNRFGLITGSGCHILFPKRSAEVGQTTYARQLAINMYFRYYDNISNWRTEHGNLSESSGFEYYQQHYDKNAIYNPPFMHTTYHGGQLDAISDEYVLDIKAPTTLDSWLKYFFNGIDDQQYHQMQMYMMLSGKKKARICAYLLETDYMANNGEQYPVDYDKRMIIVEVEKEEGWEDKLNAITPKIITMRDEFYEKLKTQFE
jgi:hypothetical protein